MERKRIRLKDFDYSKDNLFFITTCVQSRICCFGEIINGEIILNEFGKIVSNQFSWLSKQYSYVSIHEFVIMPDHVHAVIEINRGFMVRNVSDNIVGNGRDRSLQYPGDRSIQYPDNCSLPITKIKSLSELIGAFKTTVSKQIRLSGFQNFQWHKSFHDRIIRDDQEYRRIVDYIKDNPKNWKKNKLDQILLASQS